MSALDAAPECAQNMHALCTGPKTIRRPGAPAWEAPIQTLHCGCLCHGRARTQTPPVSRPEPIPEG